MDSVNEPDARRGEPTVEAEDTSAVPAGILISALRACLAFPVTLVVATSLLFIVGIVGFSKLPKSYAAGAIITPPAELDRLNIQSGLSGITGGSSALGGLAALGGPQSATMSRYETFVTLMTSRRIASVMIKEHNVLPLLYPKLWDSTRNTWKRPSGPIAEAIQWVKTSLGYPSWTPPDAASVAKYMKSHLQVTQSLKNTQRTLTFTAKSPYLAQNMLIWAIAASDAAVRADAIDRAKAQLSYVNAELAKNITNAEDRAVLSEIAMGTERSMVLASTGSTFAEQIVQPPESSELPSFPPLIPGILATMAISLVGGVAVALFRYSRRGWN